MINKNFSFPGKKRNEVVKFVFRKHWIIHLWALLRFFFIGFSPIILFLMLTLKFFKDFSDKNFLFIIVFLIFLLIFALQYAYITWINDELDIIIITNERIVDITQVTFLNRNIAEAPLVQIQDVKGIVKGLLGTVLHFGTIRITTANQKTTLDIDTVPNPIEISRDILSYVQATVRGKKIKNLNRPSNLTLKDFEKASLKTKQKIKQLID